MTEKTVTGGCFCGAVELTVTGQPMVMGYCHCDSCRSWAAAPVTSFTLWKAAQVTIVKGAEHIGEYRKTPPSHRRFCTRCGGHLLTALPDADIVDVYASVIPGLAFVPAMHVHYGEKTLRLIDGLPKFRDLPEQAGGSGELLPE